VPATAETTVYCCPKTLCTHNKTSAIDGRFLIVSSNAIGRHLDRCCFVRGNGRRDYRVMDVAVQYLYVSTGLRRR